MGLRLDRQMTILLPGSGRTGMGAPQPQFVAGRSLPCGFQQHSDTEKHEAGRTTSQRVASFMLRYSAYAAAIPSKGRLRFEDNEWAIAGSEILGRRRWVRLTAIEEVGVVSGI